MNERYTMIIWITPVEETLEAQTERIFLTLSELGIIDSLRPNFLTAMSKKLTKEFILNKENICDLILREQDKLFSDLGSYLSFFTSMNNDESNGIRIKTGITNPKFTNSIVINIHSSNLINDDKKLLQLIPIFKKLVKINKPFYACIVGRGNKDMYVGHYLNEKEQPKVAYWMNYWGKDIISKIDFEQVYRKGDLRKVHDIEEYEGGYFINLTKEPTDINNKEHMALQESVNFALKL